MGVRGLFSYLKQHPHAHAACAKPTPLSSLQQLVVDGDGLVFHLFEAAPQALPLRCSRMRRADFSDHASLSKLATSFVSALAAQGIQLTVVFDGACETIKAARQRDYLAQLVDGVRRARQELSSGKASLADLDDSDLRLPLPPLAKECIVAALRASPHCSVLFARGEADLQLARECRGRGADAVLALDSDFLVFDTPGYVPFTSLDFHSGAAMLYSPEQLAAHLQLPVHALSALACLVGNDFVIAERHLASFHQDTLALRNLHYNSVIPKVLAYMHANVAWMEPPSAIASSTIARALLAKATPQTPAELAAVSQFREALAKYAIPDEGDMASAEPSFTDGQVVPLPVAFGHAFVRTAAVLQPLRERAYASCASGTLSSITELTTELNRVSFTLAPSTRPLPISGEPLPSLDTISTLSDATLALPDLVLHEDDHTLLLPVTALAYVSRRVIFPDQYRMAILSALLVPDSEPSSPSSIVPEAEAVMQLFLDAAIHLCMPSRGHILFSVRHYRHLLSTGNAPEPSAQLDRISALLANVTAQLRSPAPVPLAQLLVPSAQQALALASRVPPPPAAEVQEFGKIDGARGTPTISPYKTAKSTVAFVLPPDLCDEIQWIRAVHDKSYERWPPHVNLLYPFFKHAMIVNDSTLERLAVVLEGVEPFTISFREFGFFQHAKSCTLFLRAESFPACALGDLQRALEAAFPECDDLTAISGEFFPHLSIAQFASVDELQAAAGAFRDWFHPIEGVPFDHVSVLHRDGKSDPFKSDAHLPLGGSHLSRSYDQYAPPPRPAQAARGSAAPIKFPRHKFVPMPTYRFDSLHFAWMPSSEKQCVPDEPLTVVSFNVLFDLYHTDQLHSEERWARLIREIEECDADIVGLQEVTQPFLSQLMASEGIRSQYFVSDSGFGETCEPYGQVLLARGSFELEVCAFSRSKRVILGKMATESGAAVHTAVVHLTSDHHGSVEKRVQQMQLVTARMTSFPDAHCLMIGDFNFGDGEEGEEYMLTDDRIVDAWAATHPRDPGFTFDPHLNTMAAITTKRNRRRRLDRVLVLSPTLHPHDMSLLGTESFGSKSGDAELFPSDHFGLRCVLASAPAAGPADAALSSTTNSDQACPWANGAVEDVLASLDVMCDAELLRRRADALSLVKSQLQSLFPDEPLEMFELGSGQLGTATPSSDIDMVCAGPVPRGLFFKVAPMGLAKHPDIVVDSASVATLQDSLVPIIRLTVMGVPADLQYAMVGVVDQWFDVARLDAKRLDAASASSVCGLRDNSQVLKSVPNVERWRLVFHAVKMWAKRQGFYSNRLGYLGGFGWAVLTARVCRNNPSASASALVWLTFNELVSFDWDNGVMSLTDPARRYRRKPNERMVLLTPTAPHKNIARNVTSSTLRCLLAASRRAMQTPDVADLLRLDGLEQFVDEHAAVLRLTVSALTPAEYVLWVGYVESRLVRLLCGMEESAPRLGIHLFGRRFHNRSSNYPCSGCFLVGLRLLEEREMADAAAAAPSQPSAAGKKSKLKDTDYSPAMNDFIRGLDMWEHRLPTMDFGFKQVKTSSVRPGALKEDHPSLWDVEEYDDVQDAAEDWSADEHPGDDGDADPAVDMSANAEGVAKMRAVEKVYAQIKYDPRFTPSEFVIVYEDRFVGIKEMPFNSFRKDDDHWMPWHRVIAFTRHGRVMWDKRTRTDRLKG